MGNHAPHFYMFSRPEQSLWSFCNSQTPGTFPALDLRAQFSVRLESCVSFSLFSLIYPICTFPGLRERSHPLASQRTNLVVVPFVASQQFFLSLVKFWRVTTGSSILPANPSYQLTTTNGGNPPPYIYPQPNYLLHRSLWILFDTPVVCLLVLEPVSCVLTLNPQPLGIPSQHCRQRDTAEPPSNDFAIPISGSNDNDRLELNAPRSSPSSPSHTAHHVDLAATGRPLEGACHSPQGHFEPCLT